MEKTAEIETDQKPQTEMETKKKRKMAEKEAEMVPTKKQTTSEADEVDSWTVVRDRKKERKLQKVRHIITL